MTNVEKVKKTEGAEMETSSFDPEQFVRDNMVGMRSNQDGLFLGDAVVQTSRQLFAQNWSCVDGRIREGGRYACPGGALGLLFAVFAGVESLEQSDISILREPRNIARDIKTFLHGMSCHTDAHAVHDGADLICEGCGHCYGALLHSKRYGIAHSKDFLVRYLKELKTSGVKPEVLEGKHNERAVLVMPPNIGLPGTGKNGEQVFVCHLSVFYDTVEMLARLEQVELGVSGDMLVKAARKAAEYQLCATLDRLAHNRPIYEISVDASSGGVTAFLVTEDASTLGKAT